MRLIDAEALLDNIPEMWIFMDVGRVVTAPTVEAVPVINGEHCECSSCRTVVSTDLALNHKTRYCMGCGAKMDGDEDAEEH